MNKFSISIFLFLFSSLIFISCSETSNAALDAMEETVVVYENFIADSNAKGKLCTLEYTDFMTESQKKIIEMGNAMESQDFSAKDTTRYLDLNNRLQKAFMGLGQLTTTLTIDDTC